MVEVKIGKKKYRVKNIMELNVKDYFSIQDAMFGDISNENLQSILRVVTKIPEEFITQISIDSFSSEEFEQILNADFDESPLNRDFGKGLIRFNDILVGTYLDILRAGSSEASQEVKMTSILALLYSGDQNYTLDEFMALQEDILANMSIKDALETYQSFDKWRESLQKHYEGLWETSEEEDDDDSDEIFDDEEEEKEDAEINWGLEGAVMNLAGEDILNRNKIKKTITIIEMFEWLAFQLYKSEKERAKNKQK